jgi:hypothetical protein
MRGLCLLVSLALFSCGKLRSVGEHKVERAGPQAQRTRPLEQVVHGPTTQSALREQTAFHEQTAPHEQAAAHEPGEAVEQGEPSQPGVAWYELKPLLVGLRPALRAMPPLGDVASELPYYELDVTAEGDSFRVRETLWFTQREAKPLSELVLRLYANADASGGASPRIRLVHGSCLDNTQCRVEARSAGTLIVTPTAPLPHGARLRVALELTGSLEIIDASRTNLLAQGLEGMQRLGMQGGHGGYGLLARGDGIVLLANFYAVLAARRGGEWVAEDNVKLGDLGSDELSHVVARVVTEKSARAAASGVQVAGENTDGHTLHSFTAAYVRDFTVLWSRSFETSERKVGDVAVRSYHLAAGADAGARVLDTAASALALFEQRFGPYPYPELDVVEAPLVGGAGGVEFCGLLTVASMFYRPLAAGGAGASLGVDLSAQKPLFDAMREFVTAHEVAHQYWHGLVGNDSRENPFADEALAQYSALLYIEARHGRERAELEARRQVAMNYQMMRMMQIADGPVDRPVRNFAGELEYAGLIYGKGPFVYRELRRTLGDDAFFAGLHAYVERYRFAEAPGRGLIELLAERSSGAQVRALAAHWLEQAHGDSDLGQADPSNLLGGAVGTAEAKQLLDALPSQLRDPNLKSLVEGLSNPEAQHTGDLQGLDALQHDPAVQQLLNDPELQQMLQGVTSHRGVGEAR